MQDIWFYVSVIGFAFSALLWPYFLVQFRGADSGRTEEENLPPPTRIDPIKRPAAVAAAAPAPTPKKEASGTQPVPVISKTAVPAPQTLAPVQAKPPLRDVAELPVRKIVPEAAAPQVQVGQPVSSAPAARPAATSTEVSAAATYLRDMKTQLDLVQKEMKEVQEEFAKFDAEDFKRQVLFAVQKQASLLETMQSEWSAMKDDLREMKENAAPAKATASLVSQIAESLPPAKALEKVQEERSPEKTAIIEPEPEEPGTIYLEPNRDAEKPRAEASPEENQTEPKRRGPVWPV